MNRMILDFNMDSILNKRLQNLERQVDMLTEARGKYLLKEGERKSFESRLIKESEGKSHVEKTVNAQATEEWLQFHVELAALETEYEHQKLRHDLLDKVYLAEHLSAKLDADTIKRQGA